MSAVLGKWHVAKISDFAKTTSGGTPSRKNPEYYTGQIPWIKSGDLNDGNVSQATEFITEEALKNSSAKLFPAGTLMIALYGATIGKLGILTIDAATNQAVCGIFVPEEVETKYLFYFLLHHRRELVKKGAGGAQPNISQGIVRDIKVPLPPLPEQRRIVARIEELFSRLDAGVAALHQAKAQLQRYRQSVLTAAVTGELTKEWREQNPDTEVDLQKAIYEERQKNWEVEEMAKYEVKEKLPKNNQWKERYKAPNSPELEILPKIPSSWCWATIDAFGFVTKLAGFEYTKFVKYDEAGDLAVIKAENAGPLGFRRTNFSRVKSETVSNLTRSQLIPGDLLMVFVGAGTGQVGRVPDDQLYFLGPNIGMIRVQSAMIDPAYVELFLRSQLGNSLALRFAKAVAQPSISMGTIRMIEVAIPPLAEQHQIVAEVEARTTAIDHLDAELDHQLTRSNCLRQTTLATAFTGALNHESN
jgi:type I restriction enzyme S subunit